MKDLPVGFAQSAGAEVGCSQKVTLSPAGSLGFDDRCKGGDPREITDLSRPDGKVITPDPANGLSRIHLFPAYPNAKSELKAACEREWKRPLRSAIYRAGWIWPDQQLPANRQIDSHEGYWIGSWGELWPRVTQRDHKSARRRWRG
jgi:hypothetical protein